MTPHRKSRLMTATLRDPTASYLTKSSEENFSRYTGIASTFYNFYITIHQAHALALYYLPFIVISSDFAVLFSVPAMISTHTYIHALVCTHLQCVRLESTARK